MTSGIYRITFADSANYIGKSVDIERRWNDHRDLFSKGKASKKMQERYNLYGMPKFEIIMQCHKNHIDLFEEHYIFQEKPELNTVVSGDPFTTDEVNFINENAKSHFWEYSTIVHYKMLMELSQQVVDLQDKVEELKILEHVENDLEVEREKNTILTQALEAANNGEALSKAIEERTKYKELAEHTLRQFDELTEHLNTLIEENTKLSTPWWKIW